MIINDSLDIQLLPHSFELWEQSKRPFCVFKVSEQEHKVGTFLKRRATVQTELNVLCSAFRIWMTKNHINQKIRSLKAQTNPRKMQELSQELLGKPSGFLVGFYQPFEVIRIIGKKVFYSCGLMMINDEAPNCSKIFEQLHHVPFWKLTYPLPTA